MPPTAFLISNAGWPGRRGRGDRRPWGYQVRGAGEL